MPPDEIPDTGNPLSTPIPMEPAQGLATGESAPAGTTPESAKPSASQVDNDFVMQMFEENQQSQAGDDFASTVTTPDVQSQQPAVQTPPGEQTTAPDTSQPQQTQQVAPQQTPPQTQPPGAAPNAQGSAPAQQTPAVQQTGDQPVTTEDAFGALERAIEAQRPQMLELVAKNLYPLSEEDLTAVNTEPEKILPQLMARVHVNAVQGVLRHIAQQMPVVFNGLYEARERNRTMEDSFYRAWPQLDKAKHQQQIVQVGRVWRQMNPGGSTEDFVKQVGAQVVFLNGLHQQQPPASGQRPVTGTPARAPAFQPAGAAQTGGPAAKQQVNGWDQIAQLMQLEE